MANPVKDSKKKIEELEAEIARLRRGLQMISRQEGFASTVARRVLAKDGSYK